MSGVYKYLSKRPNTTTVVIVLDPMSYLFQFSGVISRQISSPWYCASGVYSFTRWASLAGYGDRRCFTEELQRAQVLQVP